MADGRCLNRIARRLEKIESSIKRIIDEGSIDNVYVNIQLLDEIWSEYKSLESRIKLDDDVTKTMDELEETYFSLKEKLLKLERKMKEPGNDCTIHDLLANQRSVLEDAMHNKRDDEIRLPRINIPMFSGIYSEFPSFRDLFQASVGRKTNISGAQKLQYLKGLLVGDAAALIRHIEMTDANYEEAWCIIKERFDNKRYVVANLLKRFIEQPSIAQPSARALHHMSDVMEEVLRGLKAVGPQAETRDPWLISILLNKLDAASKQAWALDICEQDFPTLVQFKKFLNKRGTALGDCEIKRSSHTSKPETARVRTAMHVAPNNNPICPKCNSEHNLYICDKFLELDVSGRRGFVAEQKLCFNCLRSNHQAAMCRSRFRCIKCKSKHHTVLHQNLPLLENLIDQETSNSKGEESQNYQANISNELQLNKQTTNNFQALLPTAIVKIRDNSGKFQKCRLLLDSGAQSSFISENCMQRLQLPRRNANFSIKGLTSDTVHTRGMVSITLFSCYDNQQVGLDVLILNKLPTKLPSQYINVSTYNELSHLQLADPEYNKPSHIDIMVGADKFFNVLSEGRIKISDKRLMAQNTMFGWVIAGELNHCATGEIRNSNLSYNFHANVNIDETLRKFWELEEIQGCEPLTNEERRCEIHFKTNYKHDSEGRYIVKIPFKGDTPKLGNSLYIATKRFHHLERKLDANAHLKCEYVKVMREYIELGHMREISHIARPNSDTTCFYLPHHCVVKESSKTTKIRVVFDGSCKSSNGLSINDNMLVGPTIQPTLWATLLNFRYHKIALAADIEKMYRQVIVADEDQNYQRVLWRETDQEPLKHFVLTTVTFGLASSSFLAIRALHQAAYDMEQQFPDVAQVIRKDFYVDDLLTGADSLEKARELKSNIQHVIGKAKFNLRKWMSNAKELADTTDENFLEIEETEANTNVLGIQWNPLKDAFTFTVKLPETPISTKRMLISNASKIFDPLGWVSPSTIIAKMLFQTLWLRKLEWDDELPDDVAKIWNQLKKEFIELTKLKIERYIPKEKAELHGFSDASERAYSAVVYCRSTKNDGSTHVTLIASKTKVAPIKQVSLPRLELCGAYLLAKLMATIKNTMASSTKLYAWTDSSIVLAWLSDHPVKWKTFVGNRTAEILNSLPRRHWNHVRSNQNPADYASRGVFPSKLLTLQQWWKGPAWLELDKEYWPKCDEIYGNCSTNLERRSENPPTMHTFQYQNNGHLIEGLIARTFGFNKLIRILSFVNRFITNARAIRCERKYSPLTVKELKDSTRQVIKYVQSIEFVDEIKELVTYKELKRNSNLLPLTPFIDEDGVLRVGGRLKKSMSQYDSKYPIILPKSHILSRMIISHVHNKYLHPGPSLTSHLIRQKYWIVKGRGLVREEVRKCIKCFRQRATAAKQLMGNLPAVRITPARPFSKCGVDYAGPISIANKRGRGAKMTKGYIAVFVCMVTKAIHLEAVTDLTSDAFIAALNRFSARRGVPNEIFSDNGTNFIGAKRQLKQVFKMLRSKAFNDIIAEYLAQNSIQWHSIPPSAPHFGGLWEAAVKSVKSHLNKATNNCNLTFEEISTLLAQIEGILNSRPLCSMSEDDTTIEALTPAHFLIGSTQSSIPEIVPENVPLSRLSRWQSIQQRVRGFWNRFSKEYLNSLQQRNKWPKRMENLKINDLVLIKEDKLPSCKWALGRIVDVHPDENGLVRVVSIKTQSTIMKRPITKLCKLPTS